MRLARRRLLTDDSAVIDVEPVDRQPKRRTLACAHDEQFLVAAHGCIRAERASEAVVRGSICAVNSAWRKSIDDSRAESMTRVAVVPWKRSLRWRKFEWGFRVGSGSSADNAGAGDRRTASSFRDRPQPAVDRITANGRSEPDKKRSSCIPTPLASDLRQERIWTAQSGSHRVSPTASQPLLHGAQADSSATRTRRSDQSRYQRKPTCA